MASGSDSRDGPEQRDQREVITRDVQEKQELQKRTFTNWVNAQLSKKKNPPCTLVQDLFKDFRDGSRLLDLLGVMSGERIGRERGTFGHWTKNIERALSFLENKSIKLVNIDPQDIIDGKPSIILGLIWTIIRQYHIERLASNVSFRPRHSSVESLASLDSHSTSTLSSHSASSSFIHSQSSTLHSHVEFSAENALLLWVSKQCHKAGCTLDVNDFAASWRSGEVFLAIIHALRPGLVDLSRATTRSNKQNLDEAFHTAERELRIPRLLEPDDVDVCDPDEKTIMMYVAQFLQYSIDLPVPEDDIQGKCKTPPMVAPRPRGVRGHAVRRGMAQPARGRLSFGEDRRCGPVASACLLQSQPKAVAGSSEIGEDDNKSSDTSSTVADPGETGSIEENSNKNKDEVVKGETSVKNSQEIIPDDQCQTKFDNLLSRLKLKDNYENKLSTADFLKLSPSINNTHGITERDVAHAFLQKLLMLDYRARYIPVLPESTEKDQLRDTADSDMVATEKDVCDLLWMTNVNTGQSSTQCHVHPMDVQMAVFHCSDSFLRQNMITKLSQCQYALPLLVPDPFTREIQCPLWTFRQIRKSWKSGDTCRNMPICQAETPMVSFFRLGSVSSSSKSQLMNTLINDRHDTFFHRDCKGATKSHCLIDGMAEIAWYFPNGKTNDAFSDCVAFCNLHGDALTLEKQREILIDKASVNVVLLPTLGKDSKSLTVVSDLLTGPKPLICLFADNDSVATEIQTGKYKMGVKDRSQSDVAEELKGIIRDILSTSKTSFQLESMGNVSGIKTDEEDSECQRGKSAAAKIVHLLDRTELSKIKDTFLPCHGHLWHEWCRVNKEKYRLSGHIEKDKCEKEGKLAQIRQEQRDKPSSELMQMFIENLNSPQLNERLYFLKWIGFFLDSFFTDKLSEINQAYDAKGSEALDLKKQDTSQLLKQKELDDKSDKLQSATVGLEHILREIGQIYEAHASINNRGKWSQYPKLAAELMIAGQPMELMDGDAAHVPLTWITSVLDEVIKTLGDKRVFVLSVLGIQSSGKSTMLNAMFGLRFAVSAGRCTRGAFMQLVKVSEEMQKDLKFDYVLVVDTEGLRAPELAGQDTRHHDNELATFVIGLGNITLINIFGENASEMQDVLYIAVQAFMRMKKVKLSPSCLFVHQNVAAIDAGDKNNMGKRRLQDKLNEMTKLAAKEEGFDAESFSDVIAFDETDVKYISQLWEGSPPMAPPNPGYSESIQELKNMILSKASQSDGMTLSEFKSTIKDLWDALLNENFVFHFKNTQEIALYRKLEEEYGKWTWELRQAMLTTENQLFNRIENGRLEHIEKNDLEEGINKTYEEVKEKMKKHFDDDSVKDLLVQWKGRFKEKIEYFNKDQVQGAKQKLEEIIQQRNARKMLDDKRTEYENKLINKSQELARKLKHKAKEENELKKEFDTVWKQWVTHLTMENTPIKEINIPQDVDSVLRKKLDIKWVDINSRKKLNKNISQIREYSDYVNIRKNLMQRIGSKLGVGSKLPHEYSEMMSAFINSVGDDSVALIKAKPVEITGYDISYLHDVADMVKDKLKHFTFGTDKCDLKIEFTIDLLLHVFKIAECMLLESHNKFKKKNDALMYLENKREQYYNVFKSSCEGNSSAAVLGELLCSKMKTSVIKAVHDKTAIHLADEMKCSHPAFSGNRVNLEKHVLKSLAEQDNFVRYMNYISHPQREVKIFIKTTVKEYISTNEDKVRSIMKKNAEDIFRLLNHAVYEATEKVKTQSQLKDTKNWLREFSILVKDYLIFDPNCYDPFNGIDNFDFLKEEIKKGFASMKNDSNNLPINVVDVHIKPDDNLIAQFSKCCWVQCPFCKAICTNTLEDHSPDDHNVPFHRPSGICGWHFSGTEELAINVCTTLVASDLHFHPKPDSEETFPYKEYRNGGPKYANWRINPDESKLIYWKWFVSRFQKELEELYGKKFEGRGEIPEEWKEHTKQEAIQSLENI